MKNLLYAIIAIFLLIHTLFTIKAQPTYQKIAGDTIVITHNDFGVNVYLLDGKKLNLPVMKWFMSDYPAAYSNIKLASATQSVSNFGYGMGGVLLFSGFLIDKKNRPARKEFFTLGALFTGGGLIVQIVAELFKFSAVEAYNGEIKLLYQKKNQVNLGLDNYGLSILYKF